MRPRLLDLYCKAGGAAMGYHRAGFDVVGVDIEPQPRYPFEFHQADALEFVQAHGHEYDAIHASPPCQVFSKMSNSRTAAQRAKHEDLVAPTRRLLRASGKPYVIENVVGSPLLEPITLCGVSFGLKVYRHRLFESNVLLFQPHHERHPEKMPKAGSGASSGGYISVAGHFIGVETAKKAMDIAWMSRDELSQAIPPAYTEYIGEQLMAFVGEDAA